MSEYEYEAGTLNDIWDDYEIKEENGELVFRHEASGNSTRVQPSGRVKGGAPAPRDLLGEGEQTGLAADTTGTKYSGALYLKLDSALLDTADNIYIEAATSSSAGDEVVDVELYDATAASVIGSVSITGGSTRARSADIADSLVEGNEVYVRFTVATASATSGATFDAHAARLVAE